MYTPFLHTLDQLLGWRRAIESRADDLLRFLADHDLADANPAARLRALRDRLSSEKLTVAFVAEFSRGKSELINAIFFSDTGQRILPATPGRTTMSPVELGYQADRPAEMAMLPIQTRLDPRTLSEWRALPAQWTRVELDIDSPRKLADALVEVKRTTRVSVDEARQLGFWDDENPNDNPPRDDAGGVEVPAWRHVLINYPHPLLEQGLVVLDTPGLNAIGAEPELTLNLLPSAHATVFILAADTGVTRSDLAIWRDHLSVQNAARYVVLNKIDTLADPLATVEDTQRQIESQRDEVARVLGVPATRVFPLSARQALTGRVSRDAALQTASRLGALEFALQADLLPKRRELLESAVVADTRDIETLVERVLADRRRQLAEQMLELRGLRGKSASKVRLMLKRVDDETAEFERCTTKLQALRLVHNRMLKDALAPLSGERLRLEFSKMQSDLKASLLNLGGKKAFAAMCDRLREKLSMAQSRAVEIRAMLEASFAKLNAEYGFALALAEGPNLQTALDELALIERNYAQYLGLSQAIRLSNPAFMEQFRRMLLSKLGVVFETASAEIETWSRSASAQIEAQLRERRSMFRRRRESLERIQHAADELEGRLQELEGHDQHLQALHGQLLGLCDRVRQAAMATPPPDPAWTSTSVLQIAAQA
jgi:hypothetical protein